MGSGDHQEGGEAALVARGLSAGYDDHLVLREIDCALRAGKLTAVIGANGSGKTTLLHALSGILPLHSGEVTLQGEPIGKLRRREIARWLTLVPQFSDIGFEVTVAEAVALGRYPWVGPVQSLRGADRQAIDRAIALLDLETLRNRRLATLSGGERQRVLLARSWAQDASVFLLDEPVASLDLRFQQETYAHLRRLAHDANRAVLVADHHINLVASFCDDVWLLNDTRIVAAGAAEETLTTEVVESVFGLKMQQMWNHEGRPQFLWSRD